MIENKPKQNIIIVIYINVEKNAKTKFCLK